MVEQLSKEEVAELKEAFLLFDKDQDGLIDQKELENFLRALGQYPTEEELKNMMNEVNNKGSINFPDFLAMMVKKTIAVDSEDEIRHTFELFDKDRRGYIAPAELRAVLFSLGENLTNEEIEEMIFEVDIDGDGQISYQEFWEMMTSQ